MITNEQGQVALKYCRTVPHNVKVGEIVYPFIVRANICMCWVSPEHVETIRVMKRRNCNCGNRNPNKREYLDANESDVRRWTNGGGR